MFSTAITAWSANVASSAMPLRPEEGLAIETLAVDPLVAALPEDHPFATQRKIALQSLANEPWIFFPRAVASRLHDEIIHACHEAGFTPRVVQEARKLSTISSLVASGLGVSLVPITLTRLRLPRTVCRPLATPVPEVPLTLMWRRNDPNPALAPFLETTRSEARRFTAQGGWQTAAHLATDAASSKANHSERSQRSSRRRS